MSIHARRTPHAVAAFPGSLGQRPEADTPNTVSPALLQRVRAEFDEMQGFSPTLAQAARLFHLPLDECARLLDALTDEGVLQRMPDGTYRRVTSE